MPNTFDPDGKKGSSDNEYGYMEKARSIRKQIQYDQERIPLGGKGYEKNDQSMLPPDYKTNSTAFDAKQNRREQDAEMYEERAKRGKP